MKETDAIGTDNWPQPNEFRCWKMSFKSGVSHPSQHPRAAGLLIGEVEDADTITSTSVTRKPMPDFENLDFKIASGLRKILTGNFKKQVNTAEGKAQLEKRSLTSRQIAWMIYDFFKISGEPSWTAEIYRKSN